MERDKATQDLFNLIHDTVGATLSMKAGIENIRYKYPDNTDLMTRMDRMEKKVERVDKAVDKYYLDLKGEKRP
jgi:hypothetical protein